MHCLGDRIIYGSNGIMEIVDIREESIGDARRKYYVLKDFRENSSLQTFVPVDNERLVSTMRNLLTKAEVIELISRIKSIPEAEWQTDNRRRTEKFRCIIESGDAESIISVIKAIYLNGIKRRKEGKKNYLADENVMKKAERMLYEEFSAVLGIPENEVRDFIEKHI